MCLQHLFSVVANRQTTSCCKDDEGDTLADLTVSERPGTSFQIEIHFTVFNRFYLLFSLMKLVET